MKQAFGDTGKPAKEDHQLDDSPANPSFDPDSQSHALFIEAARASGLDPDDPWIGGYVDYEWSHLRHLLTSYELDVRNRKVLEFGCNVGGSAIVLAALGARVTALDADPAMLRIARANFARYGLSDEIALLSVDEGAPLPLPDESQDIVIANSVLEYVRPEELGMVIGELHRILRPGGKLLICGTASRIAPREIHSRRWLVNYVPQFFDRFTGRTRQRGLNPFRLARALRGRFAIDNGDEWLRARIAVHGSSSYLARLISFVAGLFGVSAGWFSPNMEMLARKPG